jgi:TRAP-type mannitol/chloroaromatic compound transport system permease small subunit
MPDGEMEVAAPSAKLPIDLRLVVNDGLENSVEQAAGTSPGPQWGGEPDFMSRDFMSRGRGWRVEALLKLSRAIDAVNGRIGKVLSWLILVVVLISAANATVRKVFDMSSNAWLELQWILFAVIYLLCSPWTLLSNEHIRIDIINGMLPKRWRDYIDVFGHVFFLLPLTVVMIITSAPFFLRSFELREQSFSAGGLPQWPAKSLILIGFTLLFLQGISELIKRIAVIRGLIPDPYGGSHTALEQEAERVLTAAKSDSP